MTRSGETFADVSAWDVVPPAFISTTTRPGMTGFSGVVLRAPGRFDAASRCNPVCIRGTTARWPGWTRPCL